MTDPHRDNRPNEAALDGLLYIIKGEISYPSLSQLSDRCGIPQ
jgi:hypothetical protein